MPVQHAASSALLLARTTQMVSAQLSTLQVVFTFRQQLKQGRRDMQDSTEFAAYSSPHHVILLFFKCFHYRNY